MLTKKLSHSRTPPSILLGAACILGVLFFNSPGKQALATVKNGFNLADALVPFNQIFQGGPPRDGIPSIDHPKFLSPQEADFLKPSDRVLGVVIENQAKAYPIRILNWHEIVNDKIGTVPFVVSYCPLCGTGMVFSSELQPGNLMTFGVSGLLFNSDVLLYDRQTESLWSQVMGQAVTGKHKGKRLKLIPTRHTTWGNWIKKHPDTLVLSRDTGALRNYSKDPYRGYENSKNTYFPVTAAAPNDYHPKERVVGIAVKGVFKAYPFVELEKNGKDRFIDSVAGMKFTIHWDGKNSTGWVIDDKGQEYPVIVAFWFAWYAFHPETLIFKTL